jgi:hypothetical protein
MPKQCVHEKSLAARSANQGYPTPSRTHPQIRQTTGAFAVICCNGRRTPLLRLKPVIN